MNTRRKRHRVSLSSSSNCLTIKDEYNKDERCSHTLETLPPEVFEMILRLLPFQYVADSIRLVSRQCSTVATAVLNGAFLASGIRLEATMRKMKSTMPSITTATDSDLLVWSRALNVLELIKVQYKMLKAVTWRYTHPPKTSKINNSRVCFYAGTLIDELNSILDLARVGPHALSNNGAVERRSTAAATNNDTREPDVISIIETRPVNAGFPRLVSFVSLCKRFMNYFERVSECRVNRSALISGCKAVDVLDCLAEGREVTGFRISSKRIGTTTTTTSSRINNTNNESRNDDNNNNNNNNDSRIITMSLRYVMRRAWFTCLQVPCAPDENSWREDQRFMYLRLRRLVGSVNEHYFEKAHFERDLMLLRMTRSARLGADHHHHHRLVSNRNEPAASLLTNYNSRPPPSSTYSGYGVYAGRFFYYGNMNKYAYDSKFKDSAGGRDVTDDRAASDDESGQDDDDDDYNNEETSESEPDADDEDGNNQNFNLTTNANNVSSVDGPPAFDLVIRVELRCTSDLVPLSVISSLGTNQRLDESSILDSYSHYYYDHHHDNDYTPTGNSELYLKLNITCPASSANRLPANFTWEQRVPPADQTRQRQQQQRRRQQRRRRRQRKRQRQSQTVPPNSSEHIAKL